MLVGIDWWYSTASATVYTSLLPSNLFRHYMDSLLMTRSLIIHVVYGRLRRRVLVVLSSVDFADCSATALWIFWHLARTLQVMYQSQYHVLSRTSRIVCSITAEFRPVFRGGGTLVLNPVIFLRQPPPKTQLPSAPSAPPFDTRPARPYFWIRAWLCLGAFSFPSPPSSSLYPCRSLGLIYPTLHSRLFTIFLLSSTLVAL